MDLTFSGSSQLGFAQAYAAGAPRRMVDANKVGLSPPPIETSEGWLMIYHAVRHTAAGCLYRLGLALFDLEKPDICIARGDSWIFGPEAPYEREGDVGNVTFPCGLTIGPDGDTIFLYY